MRTCRRFRTLQLEMRSRGWTPWKSVAATKGVILQSLLADSPLWFDLDTGGNQTRHLAAQEQGATAANRNSINFAPAMARNYPDRCQEESETSKNWSNSLKETDGSAKPTPAHPSIVKTSQSHHRKARLQNFDQRNAKACKPGKKNAIPDRVPPVEARKRPRDKHSNKRLATRDYENAGGEIQAYAGPQVFRR